MEKTLGYIFGDLQVLNAAMTTTLKSLKKQKRSIGVLSLGFVACGAYILYNEKERKKEEEKRDSLKGEIQFLKERIEELKESKGE